jgi:type IV secretory pathway TraG/TraD family ATPase VirD4
MTTKTKTKRRILPASNFLWLWRIRKTWRSRAIVVFGALAAWALATLAGAAICAAWLKRDRGWTGTWASWPWPFLLAPVGVGAVAAYFQLRTMRKTTMQAMQRGKRMRIGIIEMTLLGLPSCFWGGLCGPLCFMWAVPRGALPTYAAAWKAAAAPVVLFAGWLLAPACWRAVVWLFKCLNFSADLVDEAERLPGVPVVIRGRAFWPLHAMRAELERFLRNDGVSYGEVRVQFGGLTIPEKLLGPHSVFCGATGAGKTVSMQLFVGTALFMRRKLRHRVVTHDVKGDQSTFFRHSGVADSDLILCDPGSSRGWAWDLAADVRDHEGARQLAAMLCPLEKSSQPYFSQVAQELATEVLQVLQKIAPRAWTLRDVVLVCRSRELLHEILGHTESGRAAWRNHVENNAASTAGSLLSTLASKLGSLSYTAGRWSEAKSRFSLRAFLRDDPKVLLLRNRANRSEVATPVFRALLRFMAEDVLAMPENHDFGKTWFVLDEVPSLGVFEKLDTFLSQARSKGGHVLLGFQDIDALASVWGRERANALVGLCTNVTCLQTSSPTTAAYWTKAFGSYKFPEVSVTESYGHKHSGSSRTTANKTEEAILESEIMNLPPASMQRGIVGCYMTPMVGMWRGETSPEVMRPLLPNLTKNKDDEIEDAEVELLPWNAEDRARLGLELRMHPDEDRPRGIPGKDGGLEATG